MGIHKTISAREFEDPEYRAAQFHPMNDEQTTIGAILEMEPGSKESPQWVNEEFTAEVIEAKPRQGKKGTFYTGTLVDPDTGASIPFSAFGRKFFPPAGSVVLIGGQGISLGEYNGNPQLTIGQKARVNAVGGSPARASAPPARSAAPAGRTAPPARNNAPAGHGAILGVTVGMAVNNACALTLAEWQATENMPAGDAAYWRLVWERASAILRISAVLEKGKLAPKPGGADAGEQAIADEVERADAEEAARIAEELREDRKREAATKARPQPGPGGSVALDDVDDSVPF